MQELVEEGNKTECLDFARRGTNFATGGSDARVRIYDVVKQVRVLSHRSDTGCFLIYLYGHSSKVTALRFHPTDQNFLISCGWERLINIWDLRMDKPIKNCTGPMVTSEALDVGQHGLECLTGSTNPKESLQIWDISEKSETVE